MKTENETGIKTRDFDIDVRANKENTGAWVTIRDKSGKIASIIMVNTDGDHVWVSIQETVIENVKQVGERV